MFQIELLSGGVFVVYAVDTQENMFLIYRDDNWNWIRMERCRPYFFTMNRGAQHDFGGAV